MTEQHRPQSRMVPALTAALVGVLLGALVVVVGVLAGQRGGCCCCNCYGPVCGEAARDSRAPAYSVPGRPIYRTPTLPQPDRSVPPERPAERAIGLLPSEPGRPITPWHAPIVPPWVRPELQRHDVPLPGSLMLVALGAVLIGKMS